MKHAKSRETDQGRSTLLLLATWAVTTLSLGVFIGTTHGDLSHLFGLAGAAIGLLVLVSAPSMRSYGWILVVLGSALGGLRTARVELAIYVGLLTVFIFVGWRLAGRAVQLGRPTELDPHAQPRQYSMGIRFNFVLEREFARARRHNLAMSIASISLLPERPGSLRGRRTLGRLAHALSPHVRRTDTLGLSVRNRIILLLPHTNEIQAGRAVNRLRPVLSSLPGVRVQIGTASFPDHGLTWERLRTFARQRERPSGSLAIPENTTAEVG
jgi:hypothetical protein